MIKQTHLRGFSIWQICFILILCAIPLLLGCGTAGVATATSLNHSATLQILNASPSSGTVELPYTASLSASGGQQPYAFTITAGALPSGLALDSTTGLISGTPVAAGNFPFTVQVKDARLYTASANLTIRVSSVSSASSGLTVTTSGLGAGSIGATYSATLGATGGTSPYTWSIINGALPSGVILTTSTGLISGIPTVSGSFTVTVSVTDTANQSASAQLTLLVAAVGQSAWYLRPDGGTRAQCTGRADAAYPGSGSNQPCAFSNPYYLFTDDSSTSTFSWVIAGGDIVIIKNGSYPMGYKGPNAANGWAGCTGNPYNCYMPPVPSGTASAPTQILGESFSSCTSKPELFGTFAVDRVINLQGSSYVNVQCLNLTDHSSCGRMGTSNICRNNFPLDNYALNGIVTAANTSNILLQDLDIHGFAGRGIIGPFGGNIQATRVNIRGNTAAGWDFDDGLGTKSTGTLTMLYVTVEWNGCSEMYPPTNPAGYDHCFDDNDAGYGDGVGTPDTGGIFLVDHSIFRYNTQDGLDLLHVGEVAPATISVTNSMAYGNMGNQFKLGPSNGTILVNNVAVGSCFRLKTSFPPNPSTYNQGLTDFCRAAGDAVPMEVADGKPAIIQNNSFSAEFNIALDLICPGGFTCGTNTQVNVDNNLFFGFSDLSGGHTFITAVFQLGGTSNFLTNTGSTFRNNLLFHTNEVCPGIGAVGEVCSQDPLLASETNIDTIDFHLGSGSPAIGAGIAIPSITTDIEGRPRPSNAPYDIGAYQH